MSALDGWKSDAWTLVWIILAAGVATAAMLHFIEQTQERRFQECMSERHDKYICRPYARGGGR